MTALSELINEIKVMEACLKRLRDIKDKLQVSSQITISEITTDELVSAKQLPAFNKTVNVQGFMEEDEEVLAINNCLGKHYLISIKKANGIDR